MSKIVVSLYQQNRMRYNILDITSGEYLDTHNLNDIGTECALSTGKVTTIICKEIAPDWDKIEARKICMSLNSNTSHIWKIEEVTPITIG